MTARDDDERASVRLVCWVCAQRYAFAVDAACPLCLGEGVVAAPVPVGIRPIVAARAASMTPAGKYGGPASDYVARRAEGRLEANSDRARCVSETLGQGERQSVGRLAHALLTGRSLPPAAWAKVTPADRLRVARELVAIAAQLEDG